MSVLASFKKRRTQYVLGNQLPMSQAEVEALIKDVVRETPSAFHSQSSRLVILFNEQHGKFWHLVKETLRPLVPAENFSSTDEKIDGFAKAAGTVLFFEDQEVIKGLQEKFPLYAAKFPEFSCHSSGMAQFAVWTALANQDIGASLQHYNPLIDEQVSKIWGLPSSWQLSAQMPFGSNEQAIADKTHIEDTNRFLTFA